MTIREHLIELRSEIQHLSQHLEAHNYEIYGKPGSADGGMKAKINKMMAALALSWILIVFVFEETVRNIFKGH